jgi:hypothetical protein
MWIVENRIINLKRKGKRSLTTGEEGVYIRNNASLK